MNDLPNPTSTICDGCRKAAMYTVAIGKMAVCEECIDKAKDEVAFKTWMANVDKWIGDIAGLSSGDLAGQTYRDWFDEGLRPDEVAEIALEAEGFYE